MRGWLALDRSGLDWWGREVHRLEYGGALSPGVDGVFQTHISQLGVAAAPSRAKGDDVLYDQSGYGANRSAPVAIGVLYVLGSGAAWSSILCLGFASLYRRPISHGAALGGRRFLAECLGLSIVITLAAEAAGYTRYRGVAIQGPVREALWVVALLGGVLAAALYSMDSEVEPATPVSE